MSFVQTVQNLELLCIKRLKPNYHFYFLVYTIFGKGRFWQPLIPHQSGIANDSKTQSTKGSITEVCINKL